MSTSIPVAIISDCGGQAMSRMMTRFTALIHDAQCTPYESASIVEANGNIVDALDAMDIGSPYSGVRGIVACNSAPRRHDRDTNGSTIVYGFVNNFLIISTIGTLGLLKTVVPQFTAEEIDIDAFMFNHTHVERVTFNFRGLEVIPHIAAAILRNARLNDVSKPHTHFPTVEPCVWLVDMIEGKKTNLKLTILRDEAHWFKPDAQSRVCIRFENGEPITLKCFERLTNIPDGEAGIYESSSGFGKRRFLEVAVMGGSASERFGVLRSGTPVYITSAANDASAPRL